MTLYKRFRGCAPTVDALLKRNGIRKGVRRKGSKEKGVEE